jgi:CheY-like chemotaxis protein
MGAPFAHPLCGEALMERNHLRLVVVDDNRDVAIGLAMQLEAHGFHVVARVFDSHEALDCIQRLRPDVAILDIAMPGLDGYDLARLIREQLDPPPRLIALTGLNHASDRVDAAAAGFDAYFVKPAPWPKLESLLLSYLG